MLATTDLSDARESLAYWEDRAQRLPRHAVRGRREARDMARRWRARVAEAERATYGAGLLGALLLVFSEGRLPEGARHGARRAARRGVQAVGLAVLACAALIVLALASFVDLVAHVV
jgi:hypothetical protein